LIKNKQPTYIGIGDQMKTVFQYIGVLVFMCFAFFYTEKAVNVVKSMDEIMVAIQEEKEAYQIAPIDAIINGNTIIPGLYGKEVDVNESYLRMKKVGMFEKSMFVFRKVKPTISSLNRYDKYIIAGNSKQKAVTLLFQVNQQDNIDHILAILKEQNIKATFFIDGKWLEENNLKGKEIANYGHEIQNYGYDSEYNGDLLEWTNDMMKRFTGTKASYCFVEQEDPFVLNLCKTHKMQTIKPNISTSITPLSDVKKQLSNGSIISFNIQDSTNKELSSVIRYILQKGYKIDTLSNLLKEEK